MLTRLKVNGFKNLVDVDVHFGPFTCIAGANGVGKSNLFDAIRFLALLADHTILEAAFSVRNEQRADTRRASTSGNGLDGLFHRFGDTVADTMRFEAEMIVPGTAVDDLGQEGRAKTTFLRYTLELKRTNTVPLRDPGAAPMQVQTEELTYIPLKSFPKHVLFRASNDWRKSAVHGACRSPLISTVVEDGKRLIRLHQDGTAGRTSRHAAARLPRTILSRASAGESPTALCVRREMASWALLQLEPTSLRRPSEYRDPIHLGPDGAHLASTLNRLARHNPRGLAPDAIYCQAANRLSELIGGVDAVYVEDDPKREMLTLILRDAHGTPCPARALSDGTLRFLALTILEMDTGHSGVLCLEEPENGIHPKRIEAMLRLLQDICTDPEYAVDHDNPLRQVIVNTHSPSVVALVPDDSLLLARPDGRGGVTFACLSDTWRAEHAPAPAVVAKGDLLAYLNPQGIARAAAADADEGVTYGVSGEGKRKRPRRVMDRPDLTPFIPGAERWVAEDQD
ncbi:MAG: AAA family ATPase [Kiritimatiellaeota bacterium]|nr:AAA family ATPase [Kiritimatiellota bacterium]